METKRPGRTNRARRQTVLRPLMQLQWAGEEAMRDLRLTDRSDSPASDFKQMLIQERPPLAQGNVPRHISVPAKLVAVFSNGPAIGASLLSCAAVVVFSGILVPSDAFGEVSKWIAIVVTVIVVVLMLLEGVRRAHAALHLAIWGTLTWSVIRSTEEVVRRVRGPEHRSTYMTRVEFAYLTGGDTVRSGTVDLDSAFDVLDEEFELLLYDPRNPNVFQFADLLPGWLRIGVEGVPQIWKPGYVILALTILTPIALAFILFR